MKYTEHIDKIGEWWEIKYRDSSGTYIIKVPEDSDDLSSLDNIFKNTYYEKGNFRSFHDITFIQKVFLRQIQQFLPHNHLDKYKQETENYEIY